MNLLAVISSNKQYINKRKAEVLSELEEREKAKNDVTKKSVFETSIAPNFINKTVAAMCALYPA